ncbi:hypothetical protein PSHT_06032 [Puccinia striiformis]|uniref:Uncharacterized protein n=1 Tax=Puccinia striiformis TaxID=27350 RepID=A0A2S4W8Z2_9BASI|nr:hypothetical protein PSHT_06032 [Puccinia striiformis]
MAYNTINSTQLLQLSHTMAERMDCPPHLGHALKLPKYFDLLTKVTPLLPKDYTVNGLYPRGTISIPATLAHPGRIPEIIKTDLKLVQPNDEEDTSLEYCMTCGFEEHVHVKNCPYSVALSDLYQRIKAYLKLWGPSTEYAHNIHLKRPDSGPELNNHTLVRPKQRHLISF